MDMNLKKRLKGLLGFWLAVFMAAAVLPASALAAEWEHTTDSHGEDATGVNNDTFVTAVASGGKLYLTGAITLANDVNITNDLDICLNGNSISSGNFSLVVGAGKTLSIHDCQGGGAAAEVDVSAAAATVNIYGGTVDVSVSGESASTVNIYGGDITVDGNDKTKVYVHGNSVTEVTTDTCVDLTNLDEEVSEFQIQAPAGGGFYCHQKLAENVPDTVSSIKLLDEDGKELASTDGGAAILDGVAYAYLIEGYHKANYYDHNFTNGCDLTGGKEGDEPPSTIADATSWSSGPDKKETLKDSVSQDYTNGDLVFAGWQLWYDAGSGTAVAIDKAAYPKGSEISYWELLEKAPPENISYGHEPALAFSAVWGTKTSYKVNHRFENTDGTTYTTEEETIEENVVSGVLTQAKPKTRAGFTVQPFEQEIIKDDRSTVVNIYYDRDPDTILPADSPDPTPDSTPAPTPAPTPDAPMDAPQTGDIGQAKLAACLMAAGIAGMACSALARRRRKR